MLFAIKPVWSHNYFSDTCLSKLCTPFYGIHSESGLLDLENSFFQGQWEKTIQRQRHPESHRLLTLFALQLFLGVIVWVTGRLLFCTVLLILDCSTTQPKLEIPITHMMYLARLVYKLSMFGLINTNEVGCSIYSLIYSPGTRSRLKLMEIMSILYNDYLQETETWIFFSHNSYGSLVVK